MALEANWQRSGHQPTLTTRDTGYVDLHPLRKTLSTKMAAAGMTSRTRQAQMRHSDPRLTENTYMDAALLPVASELQKVPAIPAASARASEPIPMAREQSLPKTRRSA